MNAQPAPTSASLVHAFAHGAEWARVDFHLHTAADREFKYSGDPNFYNSAYVDALEKTGIRIGVITNHNKFNLTEFKSLRSTAHKRNIGLLPGVELSVNDGRAGVHVLVVFGDTWIEGGKDYINPFIGNMFPGKRPEEYEQENGCSEKTLLQMVEALDGLGRDYFLVFAHVEESKGLWEEVGLGKLAEWKDSRFAALRQRTLGFQKVRSYNKMDQSGKPCRAKVRQALGDWYPAELEGSDRKQIDQIGQGRACFLKLGELSFEAVKFALFDYSHRVLDSIPEPRRAARITHVRFDGAWLDRVQLPLSDSLNCFIGPRGNGKSAVIECLRHALGFHEVSDERYKSGLVERMLSPAGKVIVDAVDEHGRSIRFERERTGQVSVFIEGVYREVSPGSVLRDVLYFGQKDLSARSESFDESFLDKLLADRLDAKAQEEVALVDAVRQAARQLKETLEASEKIAALQKEKNELDVQLQVFAEKGVDKKLEEMTLFDADRQAVVTWQQELKRLGGDLKKTADWAETDSAFPVLRSKHTVAIREGLVRAKSKSDEAQRAVESSLACLRESYATVSDAVKTLIPISDEMKTEVAALQRTFNEPNLDLEIFRKKKARLDQLTKLLAAGTQRAKTEQAARDLLGAAV